MFLQTIQHQEVFHPSIPARPMGKYAHFIVLRETNSFPLFQTDQELNFARVSAGRANDSITSPIVSRIVLFKRKQTTPERLTGRELLRRYKLISDKVGDDVLRYCEYNSERFCKHCPDCIYYGFAIGQEGSERSKVLVDSAFSLSSFDESHQTMTFNAPYEHGTMSQHGATKSSFGEQDHVLPQVFFPTVITMRDPTEAGFIYVFNNILRTKRYGAQVTRTGTLENHVVGVAFTDGEIFSNLKLTQTLYDLLRNEHGQIEKGPYQAASLIQSIEEELPNLLKEDHVTTHLLASGENLKALIKEVGGLVTREETLVEVLRQACAECEAYSAEYGAGNKSAQDANKGKNKATKPSKS
ncbi:MAG: type I-D CRISPR-associated protein Cas7/Csc2 [Chloroflexi bacterium]|nr:MAG: type I-D CRISPR-associated protein Cas7/Csc2 [Chloroflexota bacterium]